MYKNQYEAIIDNINSMKILRHDMKHHLNAIEAFINDGMIAQAQKHLRTLNTDLNIIVAEKFCENYVVNVFLSSYIQKARNEKIAVDCEADIPEDIHVNSIELGLVFANSLDNAINACKQIENISERKITVASKQHY
jgi:signal transduction histidine kinase